MDYDYDLFVIGAGSGGVRAARIASQLGARVAIAEDRYLGGTCVNVGCVPKKLFVYGSEYSHAFNDAKGFGWTPGGAAFDWPTLRDNTSAEIERLNGVYRAILAKAGVVLIEGRASVAAAHRVQVAGRAYTAKYILLAVGGWPCQPQFAGAEHTIDSNEVFHLDRFPQRVLVQGGGYIAVEFAGIFAGLGSDTELVYRGPLFLRGFDEEIRRFVAREVIRSGVEVNFNTDIEKIDKRADGSLDVRLNCGEIRHVDAVFSALGRVPKTADLGLENTRVTLTADGAVEVDENFQTAEPGIYAVGDVVGRKALTPVALAEGMALARHLFAGEAVDLSYDNIATAVFCQPTIATLGLGEEEVAASGRAYAVYSSEFRSLKSTLTGSAQRILMKLIVDRASDRILGVHMAGPEAGEIVQGLAVAVKAGATKRDFDATIGIHPTVAEEFVTMREAVRMSD